MFTFSLGVDFISWFGLSGVEVVLFLNSGTLASHCALIFMSIKPFFELLSLWHKNAIQKLLWFFLLTAFHISNPAIAQELPGGASQNGGPEPGLRDELSTHPQVQFCCWACVFYFVLGSQVFPRDSKDVFFSVFFFLPRPLRSKY